MEPINTPFKQALTLLRDLADMQNGAPLVRYENEYNELMQKIYDFLNEHEAQVKPDSIAEYYMTVGKLDEMKAKVKVFENGFGSTIFPSGDGIANLIKEPLPLKKRESINKHPQGMHPKTWAFLNKHKN